MILPYKGKYPTIAENAYIAPTAVVIGDVFIAEGASVWFNAVIRGDKDRIEIGPRSNVQDNCTLHVDEGAPLHIGSDVTIGHNAVVHGCTIEDRVLIGINAVVLNHSRIRTGSVVAASAVVAENQDIGPCQLAAGVPARIKKEYDAARQDINVREASVYVHLLDDYRTQ